MKRYVEVLLDVDVVKRVGIRHGVEICIGISTQLGKEAGEEVILEVRFRVKIGV